MCQPTPYWLMTLLALTSTAPTWAQEQDTLKFRVNYTLQTDSNLQRLPSSADVLARTGRNSTVERIGITMVGMSFNKAYSLQRLELDLNLVDYDYQNFSQYSFTAKTYAAAWRWSLTPRFHGSLTSDRKEALNSFSDYQGGASVNQRNLRTTTNSGFDASYEIDGTWGLLAGLFHTNQTSQQTLGTGEEYSANTASVGVRRALGSNSTLSYNIRTSNGQYLTNSANSREYDQLDNELRLYWALSGNTTANLVATYINRSHPSSPQRDYSGLNTSVNVNWAITGKTALVASWVRQLGSYQTSYASYTQTNRLSMGPTWQVGSKTTLGLRYDLSRIDYLGAPTAVPTAQRQDTLRDTSLTLKWQPYPLVTVIASVAKNTRDATVTNLSALDYRSNVGSVSAQFSF